MNNLRDKVNEFLFPKKGKMTTPEYIIGTVHTYCTGETWFDQVEYLGEDRRWIPDSVKAQSFTKAEADSLIKELGEGRAFKRSLSHSGGRLWEYEKA